MEDIKTGGYCPVCLRSKENCTCLMDYWDIVGENKEKRVFKIPIENIPEEEIEDYIKKIAEKFKTLPNVSDIFEGESDIILDVKYFTEKRDDLLERLNRSVIEYASDEIIQGRLNVLLRVNKQLELIEDAIK